MAIPNESLSSLILAGLYLSPDNLDSHYLQDYELGGIGLNDTSEGMRYQIWTLQLVGDDVVVSAPEWPQTILFDLVDTGSIEKITELSLAFDQNMNPFVAFVQDDQAKFWWYDSDLPGITFTNLPAGARTPRCCLDDKRETQTPTSDIILSYIEDDKLYYRYQLERYITAHLLKTDVTGNLVKVGMNNQNRLQWTIQDPPPPGAIC